MTSDYAANVSQPEDDYAMIEMQQETTTALANLASTTTLDRNTFTILTKMNSDQFSQITSLTAQLLAAQQKIMNLTRELGNAKARRNMTTTPQVTNWDPTEYCWSHGYKVTCGHNSGNCNHKKPGHLNTATRVAIKGGKEYTKGWSATLE